LQNQITKKSTSGFSEDLTRQNRLRRLANALTLLRIAIGLPVILALSNQRLVIAWFLILFGGITDITDGALARKAGGGSKWGAQLDPLADKILLLAPLLWLVSDSVLPFWSIWLLITRELIISLWRSSQKKGGPASIGGKIKTILQFISILFMIWPNTWGGINIVSNIQKLGWYLFWISLVTALLSALKYLKPQSSYDPC